MASKILFGSESYKTGFLFGKKYPMMHYRNSAGSNFNESDFILIHEEIYVILHFREFYIVSVKY